MRGVRQTDRVYLENNSEVKLSQIYDARLCTSNHEKPFKQKINYPISKVGCRYGVQRVVLNLPNICLTRKERSSSFKNSVSSMKKFGNVVCICSKNIL